MSRALVTGGASGIGAATVLRLRGDGMLVAALDSDRGRLGEIDADARVVADVTSEQDVRRGIDEAAAALGGLDVAVVASQLGLVAAADAAAYCASKGAAVLRTRGMAVDHGPEGIRVNCVCPGPTTTPLLEAYFELSTDPDLEQARYAEAQVHGRLIEPEEIADAIAYLASPGASSTIGAALVVDGGYSIR